MTKNEMIEMLYVFDSELKSPLEIVVTGASALIIRGCISRASNDIVILSASDRLDQGYLKELVVKIALKFNLNNNWIDIRSEEATFRDLPGFEPDLEKLEGAFKYLQPYIISKADSVITKFAHFTNIRQWDRGDIKATDFNDEDFCHVRRKLDILSKTDPERALRIEIEFKSCKREFIKTDEGFSFTKSDEVVRYAKKRYGMVLDNSYKKQLDDDVLNMRTSYEKAIITIDVAALDEIVKRS